MHYLEVISCFTPLGEFSIIVQQLKGEAVVGASGFGDAMALQTRLSPSWRGMELRSAGSNHPYGRRIDDYFKGDLNALNDIPCRQEGSVFLQRVWQVMRTVPPGQTLTYKELANHTDHPAAVRATGTACGNNKIILIIPCHRIVRSDGGLGGYVYGAEIKRALLLHEARR